MDLVQSDSELAETVIVHPVSVPAARAANQWPEAHEVLLRALYDDGLTFSQISKRIRDATGVYYTRSACIGKSARLGFYTRTPVQAIRDRPKKHLRRRTLRQAAAAREIAKRLRRLSGSIGPDFGSLREAPAAPSLDVGILSLTDETCRYPYGDGPFTFCGHPIHESSSYCEAHARLCTISRAQRFPCEPPVNKLPPHKIICSADDAVVSESR